MTTDRMSATELLAALTKIDRETLDRWDAEHADFLTDVEAYVATLVPDTSSPQVSPAMIALQRRMAAHFLLYCECDEPVTPAELADALGERNRKLVREAARFLARRGLIAANVEPCDTAEGERVLGYELVAAGVDVFDAYVDARRKTLVIEADDAVKQ